MPHWFDAVHEREPAGMLRQVPVRQNWPVLHSALVAHEGWQRPLLHVSPVRHSVLAVHVRRGSQAPLRQLQLE
jgi:hypothetical protein